MIAKIKVDGVLSSNNIACYVFLTYLLLGKIDGISKHAFMPYFSARNNKSFNLLDVGTNKDCDAKDLVTFAKMGNTYTCKFVCYYSIALHMSYRKLTV